MYKMYRIGDLKTVAINLRLACERNFHMSTTQHSTSTDVPNFDMENPFLKEKQKCILCRMNISPDYKNIKLLSQFQSPYTGRIYGSHITGLCEQKQKRVEAEILKAQGAGLMGYYLKEPGFIKDPRLFDSENPIRPHRF